MLSPLTAVVFSVVCWLVFSKLFDMRDLASLPAVTRRFLLVQPWWFGAGLIGLIITALDRIRENDLNWRTLSAVYSFALAGFSVINIGWGIVAIYLLILTPVTI